jgi:hypothetical protein
MSIAYRAAETSDSKQTLTSTAEEMISGEIVLSADKQNKQTNKTNPAVFSLQANYTD